MAPVVSIVLPVYNCPQYVGQAISSMLSQTMGDFELVVIDDGSTDETPRVLERYRDPRVRLIFQSNHGLAATLNRGIETARGRYIARQDQDDYSFPTRLARQVEYMEGHPDCAIVGTWAEIYRDDAPTGRRHQHPSDNASLKYELLLDNPFVHSSVMLRTSALKGVGGYSTDPLRQPPEDYELWSRLARVHEVANLPEALHVYREVHGSMSRDGPSPFMERLVKISAENISWAAGRQGVDASSANIAAIAHGAFHLIHGSPDYSAMREVYLRAAGPGFARAAEQKMRGLRLTYPHVFGASPWLTRLERVARRLLS
jgi:glycosyltransferase involved in cell wall biosynthesis